MSILNSLTKKLKKLRSGLSSGRACVQNVTGIVLKGSSVTKKVYCGTCKHYMERPNAGTLSMMPLCATPPKLQKKVETSYLKPEHYVSRTISVYCEDINAKNDCPNYTLHDTVKSEEGVQQVSDTSRSPEFSEMSKEEGAERW